jgi:Putative zinc-finger
MGCELTEEVSLLVDGELPPHEAARLRAHVEICAACEQARDSFLLLRQELRSYEWTPDAQAQSKSLAAILSGSSDGETAVPSAAARVGRRMTPREAGWLSWERLAEVFSMGRLRPAHVAALALLLIGGALGLRWLAGSHTSDGARQPDATALANTNSQPVRAEAAAEDGEKKSKDSDAVGSPTIHQAKTKGHPRLAGTKPNPRVEPESARVRRDVYRTRRQRREGLNGEVPRETARMETPALRPSPVSASTYPAGSLRAAASDPALRIGRHAERVERLLRSFRNARLTAGDPTLDVADARRLSKRLLYSNITLRREAAGAGDLPVEGLLDSVEPILLDISNLPNNPSPAAVGSIKERIRRRQLVGVLQAQAMLASNR